MALSLGVTERPIQQKLAISHEDQSYSLEVTGPSTKIT
jgi:hypothetical protein